MRRGDMVSGSRMSSPTVPERSSARCSVGSALVKTDLWVEVCVQDVGEKVEHDHGDRDDHEERQQLREVANRGGVDEVHAHPRVVEDVLGDDQAADQRTEIEG